MTTLQYTGRPLTVSIGSPSTVQLPARVLRGRLTGFLFETDKTFVLPAVLAGMRELVRLYAQHATAQVLVTGHTDTVGSADYNRGLSCERADAVAAFLRRDVDAWIAWYAGKPSSRAWGAREDQYMLATVTDASGAGYYAGPIDGDVGPLTRDATTRFQQDHNVTASGRLDQVTRRALVAAYMALEGATLPDGAHVETHGCGQTHLAVPTGPGVAEQRNRRVEVFLFEQTIDPPAEATCPPGGCPGYPEWVARSHATIDLDQPPGTLTVRVEDPAGNPVPNATVRIASGVVSDSAQTPPDATGPDAGTVRFRDLIPDEYQVSASGGGFTPKSQRVSVVPGTAPAATPAPAPAADQDPNEPGGPQARIAPATANAGPTTAGGPNEVAIQLGSGALLQGILTFSPRTVSYTGRHPMPTNADAWRQLPTKSSTSLDLTANAPHVFPRNVMPILVEALTQPPGQPVTWAIQANGSPNAVPQFDVIEGGRKAVIHAESTGAFAVTAKIPGSNTPLVCNFVFVQVDVTQSGAIARTGASAFRSVPFVTQAVHADSGDQNGGTPAIRSDVSIALSDGGLGTDAFVNKIKIKLLQNGTSDSVRGTYLSGTIDRPVFLFAREALSSGSFPVVDTDDTTGSATKHFPDDNGTAFRISSQAGRARTGTFFDTPATSNFLVHHRQLAAARLRTIDGELHFKSAIAAISDDAPDSIAVYATLLWFVKFDGAIDYQTISGVDDVPVWVSSGVSGTFLEAGQSGWNVIAGGQDPTSQRMEAWPPNYVSLETVVYDPPGTPAP